MSLQHLTIEVLDDAAVRPGVLDKLLTVQFNPAEYSRNKGVQLAEIAIPGLDSPILQFVRGQSEKLTFELFFDTTMTSDGRKIDMGVGARSVRSLTRPMYELVKVQSETHAPPRVRLSWSSDLDFTAVAESVQEKFTLFNPHGTPLRANVSVTFREYRSLERQLKDLKLASPDQLRTYTIKRNDTLRGIAYHMYQDATVWRAIAEHPHNVSKIDHPRRLKPGVVLVIPRLDDFEQARRGRP